LKARDYLEEENIKEEFEERFQAANIFIKQI